MKKVTLIELLVCILVISIPGFTQHPSLVIQKDNSGNDRGGYIVVSSDGSLLAVADGKDIKLWNVASKRELRTFKGHASPPDLLMFNSEATSLISYSSESSETIYWNLATGEMQKKIPTSTYSANDRFVVISNEFLGNIMLLDKDSGEIVRTLCTRCPGRESGRIINNLSAFSPDGKFFAFGSGDGKVRLWDLTRDSEAQIIEGFTSFVQSLTFSPDAKLLASSDGIQTRDNQLKSGRIKVWDLEKGKELGAFIKNKSQVETLLFNPANDLLVSGNADGSIQVWNVGTGKVERTLYQGKNDFLTPSFDGFSLDGQMFAANTSTGFKIWNMETGNEIPLSGQMTPIYLSIKTKDSFAIFGSLPDAGYGQRLAAYNVNNRKGFVFKERILNPLSNLVISPDRRHIFALDNYRKIRIWDLGTGRQTGLLEGGDVRENTEAVFSPDGKFMASVIDRGNILNEDTGDVKIWNMSTGGIQQSLIGHKGDVKSIAFSPTKNLLAAGDAEGKIILWNPETGIATKTLEVLESYGIDALAFSHDGETLVASVNKIDQRDEVKIWDLKTKNLLTTIQFPEGLYSPKKMAVSPDKKLIALSQVGSVDLLDLDSGRIVRELEGGGYKESLMFSPKGKLIASESEGRQPILWETETGQRIGLVRNFASTESGLIQIFSKNSLVQNNVFTDQSFAFSLRHSEDSEKKWESTIKIWDIENEKARQLVSKNDEITSFTVSPNLKHMATYSNWSGGKTNVKLWNLENEEVIKVWEDPIPFGGIVFSPDGKILAFSAYNEIIFWDVEKGKKLKGFEGDTYSDLMFSPDGNVLAAENVGSIGDEGGKVTFWNMDTGLQTGMMPFGGTFYSGAFSSDGKIFVDVEQGFGKKYASFKFWDIGANREIRNLHGNDLSKVFSLGFDKDGGVLVNTGKTWDISTGEETDSQFFIPKWMHSKGDSNLVDIDGMTVRARIDNTQIRLIDERKNKELIRTLAVGKGDWIVIGSDFRFDTSLPLDDIEGVHWVLETEPFMALPLDIFMRQYYEPGLFQRVLKCNDENTCHKEFKPLPAISEINRVQPNVAIKDILPVVDSAGLADVVVEVESVTEDVSISSEDRSKKETKTSGVYDLRLFRDGQLVGNSTDEAKLETFIKNAPVLVKQTQESGKLLNTPEDEAWREANKIDLKDGKAIYTFKNVSLPADGTGKVEFSAYAFNSDRVKSNTSRTEYEYKSQEIRKGNTYLVSIGVNQYENKRYDLNYAANDARRMQSVLGEKLSAELKKTGSKLFQIPLVSDRATNDTAAVNNATKETIKGAFRLLAGRSAEVSTDTLAKIPVTENGKTIDSKSLPKIEPEDTLIISVSSHGYAAQSGIFYILPSDIGAETETITDDLLTKFISSDELSLWMRDITAQEMLMIVDACHSAASVQGAGFKPGPMGSRGLGQLAYDKGMRIVAATQADDVALEVGSLKQGLLSYALITDGIEKKLANTDEPEKNELFIKEWLRYSEKRVPELYDGIKDGTFKNVGAQCIGSACPKVVVRQQRPGIFDFRRNKSDSLLMSLDWK